MKFNHGIIQLYLQNKELETSPYGWLYDHIDAGKHLFQTPDPGRKEVVNEITRRLVAYNNQLFFNSDTISSLFQDTIKQDEKFTIYLVVGVTLGYDCILSKDNEGNEICILDLLQFADYGPELNKIIYVLRSAVTKKIVMHFTTLYYLPQCVQGYREHLTYDAFCYGLSEYLAWGENIKDYQLSSDKYKEKKDLCLSLFHQALQEEDTALQTQLLHYATQNHFWKRFGVVNGLFLWDYLFNLGGVDTLLYSYQKGWKAFLKIK